MKIYSRFTFDAAHQLKWHDGKCKNKHGHTYKLKIGLKKEFKVFDKLPNGIIYDFSKFSEIIQTEIINWLDHKDLNNIFDNPTAETIVYTIFMKLLNNSEIRDLIYSVELWESPKNSVYLSKKELFYVDN